MVAIDDLVEGVFAGRMRAIAKMMSLAEAGFAHNRPVLAEIFKRAGKAHVIGVTGVPGGGKSTLIRCLTLAWRKRGEKVGIVAVDPTSPFSGGAILGDRVRMNDLTADEGVFIRAMASGDQVGGLARATMDTVDILDAAGFRKVVVETVGVGQDEVDIMRAAQTVVVVSPPGLGDVFQAIKGGLIETADVHAVSKCDREDAALAAQDLRDSLSLGRYRRNGWQPPVIQTSAATDQGIDALLDAIASHRTHLDSSGEMTARKARSARMRVMKTVEDMMRRKALQADGTDALLQDVAERKLDPYAAAEALLKG